MSWFSNMISGRGGGALKKHVKSKNSLSKIVNSAKIYIKKVGTSCKGSVLIEFAVCMPVLIILLYYVNDLSKLKRYYEQTEFVAHQMVNILQNISLNKEEKIKREDFFRAASLAYLSAYPGKTMYYNGAGRYAHDLSHLPKMHIYYVEGVADGKVSGVWGLRRHLTNGKIPTEWDESDMYSSTSTDTDSQITWGTNLDASIMYPGLKIKKGDKKIIVECVFFCDKNGMSQNNYVASDSQSTCARKAFRLLFVTPKARGLANYFNSVAIFTPQRPELFKDPPE